MCGVGDDENGCVIQNLHTAPEHLGNKVSGLRRCRRSSLHDKLAKIHKRSVMKRCLQPLQDVSAGSGILTSFWAVTEASVSGSRVVKHSAVYTLWLPYVYVVNTC